MRRPSACSWRDRLGRRVLDRIGDADQAGQRAVDGHEHHGLALGAQRLGACRERSPARSPVPRSSAQIAERDRPPVDPARRRPCRCATRTPRATPARCRVRSAPSTIAAASGCSLPRSSEAARRSRSASLHAAERHDRRQRRLASRERAGLVHDQRVHASQHLDGLGVPEQHARRGAAAGGHHDRHRRGQPQRARAGDDQHRDGVDERVGQCAARAPPAPRPRTCTTATATTAGTK